MSNDDYEGFDDGDFFSSGEDNMDMDMFGADDDYAPDATPEHSYDDDNYIPEGEDDVNLTGEGSSKKKQKRNPKLIIALIVMGLIAAVAIGFTFFGGGGGSSDDAQPDTTEESSDEDNASRIEGDKEGKVVEEKVGKAYEGSDLGSRKNGTGAILAFDYYYYVDRDGKKVREVYNPDISTYDADYVQSQIDKMAKGTKHKLSITPVTIGEKYKVQLTLDIPDQKPYVYDQTFDVEEKDGKFYVKNMTSSKSKNTANSTK